MTESLLPPFSVQGMGDKAQELMVSSSSSCLAPGCGASCRRVRVLHAGHPWHVLVLICVTAKDTSKSSRTVVTSTWKPFQQSTGWVCKHPGMG